ncbi:hypothetical protein ER308_16025 [Egibacter rhizosphaerae]|uniref:Glycoside hydrolase family 38 N-terminal domain-containing protein n=1 Tax=Egibacter rhizosphaerae TaxID=1670831 RepID=A0A411YIN1_9ACTN|nr:hypothetical protein [Egibacter rhizosphaerae]QBI20932.1 hypothetical protein ER308_16025 [Egibacter rhizosphaerae]
MSATRVHVIPHTHWDREWYEPFQTFRLRLLGTVETVLAMLEDDPRFVFTFDGQTAAIEDYLELRPEEEPRVRALVREGRLLIGPWRILADEFLPSGETLVRNFETGWAVAERLGGAMPVGYLPDMFGHVAQMPQILARAGLSDAVVWRGVPRAIEHHAFRWSAPDGSSVRAEYLVDGYGHAAHLLRVEDRLAVDVQRFQERRAGFMPEGHLLMLHGADHTAPPTDLPQRIRKADAQLDDVTVECSTLPAYLQAVRDQGPLPTWHGELRSGARANVLMGVTSTRVDIKVLAGRAERALERYAEPLATVLGDTWPGEELASAWARLIENAAHDSSARARTTKPWPRWVCGTRRRRRSVRSSPRSGWPDPPPRPRSTARWRGTRRPRPAPTRSGSTCPRTGCVPAHSPPATARWSACRWSPTTRRCCSTGKPPPRRR